jgi:chromosome segregation ATPase
MTQNTPNEQARIKSDLQAERENLQRMEYDAANLRANGLNAESLDKRIAFAREVITELESKLTPAVDALAATMTPPQQLADEQRAIEKYAGRYDNTLFNEAVTAIAKAHNVIVSDAYKAGTDAYMTVHFMISAAEYYSGLDARQPEAFALMRRMIERPPMFDAVSAFLALFL